MVDEWEILGRSASAEWNDEGDLCRAERMRRRTLLLFVRNTEMSSSQTRLRYRMVLRNEK